MDSFGGINPVVCDKSWVKICVCTVSVVKLCICTIDSTVGYRRTTKWDAVSFCGFWNEINCKAERKKFINTDIYFPCLWEFTCNFYGLNMTLCGDPPCHSVHSCNCNEKDVVTCSSSLWILWVHSRICCFTLSVSARHVLYTWLLT